MSQPRQNFVPTYFVDRLLEARIFVTMLEQAGITLERHSAHFQHDTADVDWLPLVAQNNWIVLTLDKHLISRAPEIAAIQATRAGVVILKADKLPHAQIAAFFVEHHAKLERKIAEKTKPFIIKFYRDGALKWVELSSTTD